MTTPPAGRVLSDKQAESLALLVKRGGRVDDAEILALIDSLQVARAALRAVKSPVYHDTHGWFICQACHASSGVRQVSYTTTDPNYRGPVGHIEPAENPFPHKPECWWLMVTSALGEPTP